MKKTRKVLSLFLAVILAVTSGYVDLGFYCDSKGGTTVHIDSVSLEKIN